jgi:hypothetical protein
VRYSLCPELKHRVTIVSSPWDFVFLLALCVLHQQA